MIRFPPSVDCVGISNFKVGLSSVTSLFFSPLETLWYNFHEKHSSCLL
jgi:hypothetical protein